MNRSVHFVSRPVGSIVRGETFATRSTPVPTASDLRPAQILVKVMYLSMEPSMRGWLDTKRGYVDPIVLGAVMNGAGIGQVIASESKLAQAGKVVAGVTGWTEYAIVSEGVFETAAMWEKAGAPAAAQLARETPLYMLSMFSYAGLSGWYGMTRIGEPKAGETVVVSAAAGASGSVAGQIAKVMGARVVGIVGSDEKCRYVVNELGFDAAVNYKATDFAQQFAKATPNLIDVYFDNVAGETLNLALTRAAKFGRFVECGQISRYNDPNANGPSAFRLITSMRLRVRGFIILDHRKDWMRGREEMARWIKQGKLKPVQTVAGGAIEFAEQALMGLFEGRNKGKLLLQL